MRSPQILIVILATVTLTVTGCSGGGLRNLTAKSDYRTLEELENPTVVAAERREADQSQEESEKSADQEKTATVSSDRELLADKATEKSTDEQTTADSSAENSDKPLGGFRLANLFRRKTETEEISPDPFVKEAKDSQDVKPDVKPDVKIASAKRAEFESEKTAAITKATADSPIVDNDFGKTTISEVEKQAETQFDKALARQQAKEAAVETKTAAAKTTTEGPGELSFAEFLKKHQSQADPKVTGTPEAAVAAAETTATKPAAKASPDASVFDTFLEDGVERKAEPLVADQAAPPAAAATADVSVADFDAFQPEPEPKSEVAETPDRDLPTQNPFAQDALVAAEFAAPFPDNPFEETSEKHGFTRHNSDPWAALASASPPAAEPQRRSAPSQDFAWNEPAGGDAASATAPNLKVATPVSDDDSQFRQVSLTRPTDRPVPRPIDVSESASLVIPDNPETDHGRALFEEASAATSVTAEFSSDPFLTSAPFTSAPFAATAENSQQPAASAPAAAAVAATDSGGLWPWNGRTWFLLIGCLIVAVLLFMPDRQNRSNT